MNWALEDELEELKPITEAWVKAANRMFKPGGGTTMQARYDMVDKQKALELCLNAIIEANEGVGPDVDWELPEMEYYEKGGAHRLKYELGVAGTRKISTNLVLALARHREKMSEMIKELQMQEEDMEDRDDVENDG